ncbi:methyltransferase [Sinorhizobium fredii]|uniref:Methyltransferase n=1 Tax=Rhizobium fredii TaxID=380 RepID=A0A2A6M679_RHIFR|nr:class I SAM-dependent methyltransferase [Sinorhizobium fredii]PDT50363.1 methyltransferase [Sinorhizobium fredii]
MKQDFDSGAYWEHRYRRGRDSGDGSYGRLAQFKADFLNHFVLSNGITSVIELGCGDGAQLELATYPQYIGVDISPTALEICRSSFRDDYTKSFISYELLHEMPSQDLALSLDVIFHLVEDSIFERYLRDLFGSSGKYVIIYSSDREEDTPAPHVRHHKFTPWIAKNMKGWKLSGTTKNPFREDAQHPESTSFADFFVYEKLKRAPDG